MTLRLFVALEVSAEVRAAMAEVQTQLETGTTPDAIRWQPPERAHLTLLFLGEVAATELPFCRAAIARAGRSHGPIELETGGLGAFPSGARPSVLWLGVSEVGSGRHLDAVHRSLARDLAPLRRDRERQAFRPHLTLGRVRRPGVDRSRLRDLLAGFRPAPRRWTATELVLFESLLGAGEVGYRDRQRAQLDGPRPGRGGAS